MTTATEQFSVELERASKLHRSDLRARQVIDMCVAHALNENPETSREARNFGRDMATAAVAVLLRYIYENDGEIGRLVAERDHYKRLAEATVRFAPPSVTIATITGAPSHIDRLRAAASSADEGEGISLSGLPKDERRRLLASGMPLREDPKGLRPKAGSPTAAEGGDAQNKSGD